MGRSLPALTISKPTKRSSKGNERTVYVRVATLLYLRSGGTTQIVTIDPRGLEEAVVQDAG